MRDLIQLSDAFADSDEPVLITGATGTGKELFARRLHQKSGRRAGELVCVNVSAIPESIFAREFFGHTKGSFSGADRDGIGLAAKADGGTLFLDEIGDLPLELQPQLLRLLQDGTYQAIGDPAERRTNIRLVAATNADLQKLVAEGQIPRRPVLPSEDPGTEAASGHRKDRGHPAPAAAFPDRGVGAAGRTARLLQPGEPGPDAAVRLARQRAGDRHGGPAGPGPEGIPGRGAGRSGYRRGESWCFRGPAGCRRHSESGAARLEGCTGRSARPAERTRRPAGPGFCWPWPKPTATAPRRPGGWASVAAPCTGRWKSWASRGKVESNLTTN